VITRAEIRAVLADGGRVVDPAGSPVGRLVDVVLNWRTNQPAWGTVHDDVRPGVEAVIPLAGAELRDGSVVVPYPVTDVWGGSRANGRVAAAADAGAVVVPFVLGLHVGIEHDGPAAYPGTSTAPWPPVSTISSGPPWWERRQWRWPSVPTSVRQMRRELRGLLDLSGLPDDEVDDLLMAAGEAAANSVEHAGPAELPFFDVLGEVGERRARIVVQDHGRWSEPSGDGNRGRGLLMISVLADASLTVGAEGTTVVLRNHAAASG
jgi:anti-sigma regulatory factor (Ser/Thr protein kinase)